MLIGIAIGLTAAGAVAGVPLPSGWMAKGHLDSLELAENDLAGIANGGCAPATTDGESI